MFLFPILNGLNVLLTRLGLTPRIVGGNRVVTHRTGFEGLDTFCAKNVVFVGLEMAKVSFGYLLLGLSTKIASEIVTITGCVYWLFANGAIGVVPIFK